MAPPAPCLDCVEVVKAGIRIGQWKAAPLQLWVLQKAEGAQSLASSLNIGAFNLGNAFGAWLGGAVIMHGAGLGALTWVGALVPLSALLVALYSVSLQKRSDRLLVAAESNAA